MLLNLTRNIPSTLKSSRYRYHKQKYVYWLHTFLAYYYKLSQYLDRYSPPVSSVYININTNHHIFLLLLLLQTTNFFLCQPESHVQGNLMIKVNCWTGTGGGWEKMWNDKRHEWKRKGKVIPQPNTKFGPLLNIHLCLLYSLFSIFWQYLNTIPLANNA